MALLQKTKFCRTCVFKIMLVKEENVHMIIFSCFYSYGLFSFECCKMLCVEQAKNQSVDPIQPQNSLQSW